MDFNIEEYLNSLQEDILHLYITYKGLTYLPDLTRFKKLKELNCVGNKLTSLPPLPESIDWLNCSYNEFTSISSLPTNLLRLECSHNFLTALPNLPDDLRILYCNNNKLTSIPILPKNLIELDCEFNNISYFAPLPKYLCYFEFGYNPLFDILFDFHIQEIKHRIDVLHKASQVFRQVRCALQFKKQFRYWLWIKVREPKIKNIYNPTLFDQYINNINENEDLDTIFLNIGWTREFPFP